MGMKKRLIDWYNRLFRIPCDVCGEYGKKRKVYHFLRYKGKMIEDICSDCEEKVFAEFEKGWRHGADNR
jgi:hypothetical protein